MPAYDAGRFNPPAPLAEVVVRQPDRGEGGEAALMLIDSGSDATLLPRPVVASLGITGTAERYQLMAIDGTISETEAVRADLIFLGRRFRGSFLLVDAEIGVLGRDVLNHIRLLLDGPALRWEDVPPSPRNP